MQPNEETPLLSLSDNANSETVIEITPPPHLGEGEAVTKQISTLQDNIAFGLKVSDLLFNQISFSRLKRFSFLFGTLSAASSIYTYIAAPMIISDALDDRNFFTDHNFNSPDFFYSYDYLNPPPSSLALALSALNNSGCLNHINMNPYCNVDATCDFTFKHAIKKAYGITNPDECQFINFDLKLDFGLSLEWGKPSKNCQ